MELLLLQISIEEEEWFVMMRRKRGEEDRGERKKRKKILPLLHDTPARPRTLSWQH